MSVNHNYHEYELTEGVRWAGCAGVHHSGLEGEVVRWEVSAQQHSLIQIYLNHIEFNRALLLDNTKR